MAEPAFFKIPLNLPHAATVAHRILYQIRVLDGSRELQERAGGLVMALAPWRDLEDNGPAEEAARAAREAASLARALVDLLEAGKVGSDRLGQAVRNFFECLEFGEEGAQISLRAGESPDSALRPRA